MKEIFNKIKGREWDHFNIGQAIGTIIDKKLQYQFGPVVTFFSLADLLTNKSWCMAVWGDGPADFMKSNWSDKSVLTFQKLQLEGHDAAIDYIKKTMLR